MVSEISVGLASSISLVRLKEILSVSDVGLVRLFKNVAILDRDSAADIMLVNVLVSCCPEDCEALKDSGFVGNLTLVNGTDGELAVKENDKVTFAELLTPPAVGTASGR
jgi:hypothetical protein